MCAASRFSRQGYVDAIRDEDQAEAGTDVYVGFPHLDLKVDFMWLFPFA